MTTTPAKRGLWQPSTARLAAVTALLACSAISAPSLAAFAGCDHAGGGARAGIPKKLRPLKPWQICQIFHRTGGY
jgi:hypothetical protein